MSYRFNSFITTDKEVPSYERNLSICLGANGFSFSIVSTREELLTVGEVSFDGEPSMSEMMQIIKDSFASKSISLFGFKSAELITLAKKFVWVPDSLFEPGNESQYLKPICKIELGEGFYTTHNDTVGAHLVFVANTNIVSAFKICIPGLKVVCQHMRLTADSIIESSDIKSVLLLNIRNNNIDMEAFCNKHMLLSNTYGCQTDEDIVFQTINIMKQLHMEDSLMELHVCGEVNRELFAHLQQFVPNVSLYNGKKLRFLNPEFQHLHTYKHALLLS